MMLAALALAALAFAGGCMFVDARFSMAPDGATSARMEAGVLKSMMEQGEGDFTTDVDESLAEGKWTELEAFDRDQWHVQAWEGQAGPGESLFAEDADGPKPQFGSEQHTLSTVYSFEMAMPEGPVMQAGPMPGEQPPPPPEPDADDEAAEGEAEVDMEGMEQMGAAMGEMMAMMMTTGDAGLRFSVDLPGDMIATNGEMRSASRAAWQIDLTAEEAPYEQLVARSRLVNWPVVGKLGGQMVEMGRWDLVPALIAGVRRGVLPDPATDDPGAAEVNTLMYVQATEIMVALDAAVGERLSTEVLRELGLSGDPDPAMVEEIAVRLEGMDLGAEIDQDVTEQVLGILGGG
ncbi:MAG: hypothetical protein GF393_04255 [Armatimonadia bacterium]|nr:hypothetical protein [Armatimonadia bacterium]